MALDHDWMKQAACKEYPMPEFTDYWVPSQRNKMPLKAREICASCPVRIKCREFAQQQSRGRSHKEVFGNLDGRTPVERFQEMKTVALGAKIAAERKQREEALALAKIPKQRKPRSDSGIRRDKKVKAS